MGTKFMGLGKGERQQAWSMDNPIVGFGLWTTPTLRSGEQEARRSRGWHIM